MEYKNLNVTDKDGNKKIADSSDQIKDKENTALSVISNHETDMNRKGVSAAMIAENDLISAELSEGENGHRNEIEDISLSRKENKESASTKDHAQSSKEEIESSNTISNKELAEMSMNFLSTNPVKFDLFGGKVTSNVENEGDESHDEQMVSLEETGDSSQNNEEYFSAKEFNFGIDPDETTDAIKRTNEKIEEPKFQSEATEGKSKEVAEDNEERNKIKDSKTTDEIRSNDKNSDDLKNTNSDDWDSKITDDELTGAELQKIECKSDIIDDKTNCKRVELDKERSKANYMKEMLSSGDVSGFTNDKDLKQNNSSSLNQKESIEDCSVICDKDVSPIENTSSGTKEKPVDKDSAILKDNLSSIENASTGIKEKRVDRDSAILKNDVSLIKNKSNGTNDTSSVEKDSTNLNKDESSIDNSSSRSNNGRSAETKSANFNEQDISSIKGKFSNGLEDVPCIIEDSASLNKDVSPLENTSSGIKNFINSEGNGPCSNLDILSDVKQKSSDQKQSEHFYKQSELQNLKSEVIDNLKITSGKSADEFNFPKIHDRHSDKTMKTVDDIKTVLNYETSGKHNFSSIASPSVHEQAVSNTNKDSKNVSRIEHEDNSNQKDEGMEESSMAKVASITTSVIDFPFNDKTFSSIPEQDEDMKNSLDSLENDSLDSVGYNSNGSNESLNRLNAKNGKTVIPSIIVSQEEFNDGEIFDKRTSPSEVEHTNDGRNNKKLPPSIFGDDKTFKNNNGSSFPIEIQTCGKCDQSIIRQIEQQQKYDLHKETNKTKMLMQQNNNKLTNEISKDDNYLKKDNIFMIKNGNYQGNNGNYNTAGNSRSPRGSDQYDGLTITDVSPEKRGSIFAKMSTLPLDGSDDFGKRRNSRKPYLLDDENEKFNWKKLLAQVLAVSAKNTLALNFGMSIGFQTIAIPSLSKQNDDLYLDTNQISLFGSLFFMAIPLGCLLSGPTIHGWGRKPAMLTFCIPLFFSWWIYYWANSPALLYLAILIMGLVNGLLEAPILTYVAEVTEARWRGMLASTSIVASLFGIFLQLLFGNLFNWRTAAAVNSAFPILSLITICFVPESPHWLAGKGRVNDVEKALMWLRGWTTKESVAEEVASLMSAHNQQTVAATPLAWKAYASRTFVEPFLLVLTSFAIGHFSGMATVQTYSVSIFDDFGVSGWSWTAAMGATQVLGALACVIALPLIGKRPIASLSMLGVAVGMAGAALAHGTLAASSLLLANFCTNACSRVVPWVLIGEVFTNEMRAVASGLSSCIGYAIGFVMSYTYLGLIKEVTLRGMLGIYATFGLIGAFAYYFYLPETEGKSLAEVQQYFSRKNNDNDNNRRNGMDNLAFERDKP